MLDVAVRFKEKDATVKYVPGKVTLDQILKQYDDTPFGVSPDGPVVTIARTKQVTLRGWTQLAKPDAPKTDKTAKKASKPGDQPKQVQLFVELVSEKPIQFAVKPQFELSESKSRLELLQEFRQAKVSDSSETKGGTIRFNARLFETVVLEPGEVTVPIAFKFTAVDEQQSKHAADGKLEVVVRIPKRKPASAAGAITTGVALIEGRLELRLGHLCDQRGCVSHFHQSFETISGLAAVDPHPDLKQPSATLFLRSGQPVDVWSLREKLRDQSVEIAAMLPKSLSSYRLRVDLPRWLIDAKSGEVRQCMVCRDRLAQVIDGLAWTKNVEVAGGGINLSLTNSDIDLIELLDATTSSGAAPSAVWLVPSGVAMPKSAAPLVAQPSVAAKGVGSQIHPIIEFDVRHACDVGTSISTLLRKQKWASRTHTHSADITLASLSIADRKYANLSPLVNQMRSVGLVPDQIRLREFGDIRIQLEFAHICGEIEYSKPPKKKKKKPEKKKSDDKKSGKEKSKKKKSDDKTSDKGKAEQEESDSKQGKDTKPKEDAKPKKPFVPRALRPAASSNGRKAIEAAINRVSWIKSGVFHDYHSKPEFKGSPRKMMLALETSGDDIVRLDELVAALRHAGFPPKSVTVSRRFAGIPFAKPLPIDLELVDRDGKTQPLATLKQQDRPIAFAFVALKAKRKKKYQADPKFYHKLGETIEQYKDRVDFIAVSANKEDEFSDVVEFWAKTGLKIPMLHDHAKTVGPAFNVQSTPAPHIFIFDANGLLRYGGDAHDSWEKPEESKEDYLAQALNLVLAGKYQKNGAVFYNSSLCNCSHPKCKCPKCGCGSTCRCGVKNCGVGF